MFSGMYTMPTIEDGKVERVDEEDLLDLLPTDTDLYVGDAVVAPRAADRVIDLDEDADWLSNPASLMIVSKDAPDAENVVQYRTTMKQSIVTRSLRSLSKCGNACCRNAELQLLLVTERAQKLRPYSGTSIT